MPYSRSLLTILVAAALLGGCDTFTTKQDLDAAKAQRDQALKDLAKVRELNDGLQGELIALRRQVDSLMALGDKRLERLYHIDRIELGSYSGGISREGEGFDYGVRVYLSPIDQFGSTLKAAGEVKVQLFDLANPPADTIIGEYTWGAEELAKQWASGFMTYHYSLTCPWKQPPKHEEITIRVQFTDYLTGKVYSEQKAVKVKLQPGAAATSVPAILPPDTQPTRPIAKPATAPSATTQAK